MLNRQTIELSAREVEAAASSGDDLSVADIIAFISWYLPLIAATVVACLLAALVYVLSAQPIYTATSQILIETSGSENLTRAVAESMMAMDTPQIESQITLLKSAQITSKVAQRLTEYRRSTLAAAPKAKPGWLRSLLFGSDVDQKNDQEPAKKSEDSANPSSGGEITGSMEVKRIGLSYALEVSYRSPEPAVAAFVANAIGDVYVQDKLELRARTAQEGGRWLEARIDELRQLMNAAALDVQVFKARRDYRILDRTPAGPGAEKEAAPPAASNDKSRGDQTTLEELESRAQTYRKIYESYLQAYTETVQRQSFPGTAARVISRAAVPQAKSSPRTFFTLAVAGVLGTMLGFGLSLAHLALDQTVRSPRQVQRKLGLPYLGEVSLRRSHGLHALFDHLRSLIFGAPDTDPNLTIADADPLSHTSHELKAVAFSLRSNAVVNNATVVGIVGLSDDLAPAALASNTALIFAQSGVATLLIDTHRTESQLLASLHLRPQTGLFANTALAADTTLLTSPAGQNMPSVLPLRIGTQAPLSAEQIALLADAIDHYKTAFDQIIVHLPPMDGSTASTPLLRAMDALVVVSKLRSSKMMTLADVVHALQIAGKPILGVINVRFA